MNNTQPEERIKYWKYHSASLSFEQAGKVAKQLMVTENNSPMLYPLTVSLHVLYSRPFKHQKQARNISTDLFHDGFNQTHKMLIKLRDRIFAHNDKDSKVKDTETEVDLFQLVVLVTDTAITPSLQTIFHSKSHLNDIAELCDSLNAICMEKANDTLKKCLDACPEIGVYRVSTDFEGEVPLLIKSELSNEQSPLHLKETMKRENN